MLGEPKSPRRTIALRGSFLFCPAGSDNFALGGQSYFALGGQTRAAFPDVIDVGKWNAFVDELLPLCKYDLLVQKMYDFKLMQEFINENTDCQVLTNCGKGMNKFYIRPNMDVVPCSCTNEVIGNILTDDMCIIKEKLLSCGHIIIDKDSACFSCEFKKICNGGCPGYSIKVFGDSRHGDIRCPKVYDYAVKNGFITHKVIVSL